MKNIHEPVDGRELMNEIKPKKYIVVRRLSDNSVVKVFRQSDLTITHTDKPDEKKLKSGSVQELFSYREKKSTFSVNGEWYASDEKASEVLGYTF